VASLAIADIQVYLGIQDTAVIQEYQGIVETLDTAVILEYQDIVVTQESLDTAGIVALVCLDIQVSQAIVGTQVNQVIADILEYQDIVGTQENQGIVDTLDIVALECQGILGSLAIAVAAYQDILGIVVIQDHLDTAENLVIVGIPGCQDIADTLGCRDTQGYRDIPD
jgi:hypothetical protein